MFPTTYKKSVEEKSVILSPNISAYVSLVFLSLSPLNVEIWITEETLKKRSVKAPGKYFEREYGISLRHFFYMLWETTFWKGFKL